MDIPNIVQYQPGGAAASRKLGHPFEHTGAFKDPWGMQKRVKHCMVLEEGVEPS